MARPRIRTSLQFYLYSPTTALNWRRTQIVTLVEGDKLVAEGKARRRFDSWGRHDGYELIESKPTDEKLPSLVSSASISTNEVLANAGVLGRSRTANLSEEDRITRRHPKTGRPMPAEDFVERAQEKVRLWTQPAPGRGDRAVRVYPKPPRA